MGMRRPGKARGGKEFARAPRPGLRAYLFPLSLLLFFA